MICAVVLCCEIKGAILYTLDYIECPKTVIMVYFMIIFYPLYDLFNTDGGLQQPEI